MINLNSQDGSNAFDQQNKRIMTVLHTQKKNKIKIKARWSSRAKQKKSTYWIGLGLGLGGALTFHFLTVGFLRKLSDVESTPKNIFFLFC